jgi:hypothetical protein
MGKTKSAFSRVSSAQGVLNIKVAKVLDQAAGSLNLKWAIRSTHGQA